MAHVVYWQQFHTEKYLYAIGNTPAVSFTNDLPPEQPGDILLLGCGDASSLLYTIYTDLGFQHGRKLDFTCCDIEPGILARNVLLYTFLFDLRGDNDLNVTIEKIWNFYYHIRIDDETFDMIITQCQRLADLSVDIYKWIDSKYGSFLRFCSQHTLSALHRYWSEYADMKNLTQAEKTSLLDQYWTLNAYGHSLGVNAAAIRTTGPFWTELKQLGALHFERYWNTGVTFTDPNKIAAATHVNPTFAYSAIGKEFILYHGCDPILSFHLSAGLASLEGQSPKTLDISALVECAMSEFETWCHAFSRRLADASASLIIRIFAGDALGFCRALHYCTESRSTQTPIYAGPWTTQLIALDGSDYLVDSPLRAPMQFNVIDSSTLRDCLGLMNVLIVTTPLLQRKPYSTIYTDALIPASEEKVASRSFLDELCGDVGTMSLLLDLCPVSYVSNFTTHSNIHEVASATIVPVEVDFYDHISWKIYSLANTETAEMDNVSERQIRFDPLQLAHFLYEVYLEMFWEERKSYTELPPNEVFRRLAFPHYVRTTLAALLNLIKSRVETEWNKMTVELLNLIFSDRILAISSTNVQDLFVVFSIFAVHELSPLAPRVGDYLANEDDPIAKKGWQDIPTFIYITFKVPREKFKHIENSHAVTYGNPVLVCNLMSATMHDCYQSYVAFFGDVKVESSGPSDLDPSITFEEDPRGMRGSSPVIFSFCIPSSTVRKDGSKIDVALSLRGIPPANPELVQVLGDMGVLFSKPLVDDKYVFITRDRPGNPGEIEKLQSWSPIKPTFPNSPPFVDAVNVTLDASYRKTMLLTRRANIVDKDAQAALADKAHIDIKQISSQAMQATFGAQKQIIPFPCAVDSTNMKIRFARKSSYIEVDVNPLGPLQKCRMSINQFPVVKRGDSLAVWNIHYLNLDRLPVLDVSVKAKLQFLETYLLLAHSDREAQALNREQLREEDSDPVLCIKYSITRIFTLSCGPRVGLRSLRVYALTDPRYKEQCNGLFCLIFVNNIRLDLASHTFVLDAFVIPKVSNEVNQLINQMAVVEYDIQAKETKAWKYLLPAFVERCRTWSHTENCEYRSKGVPVSVEPMESPLCSCGMGKDLGSFETNKAWKDFAPYVTRAAISPLFAVPYVEAVGAVLRNYMAHPEEVVEHACAQCGGPGKPKLLRCGKCRRVVYCSRECQRAHWKSHKTQCSQ